MKNDDLAFSLRPADLQDVITLLSVQRLALNEDQREIADLVIAQLLKLPEAGMCRYSVTWLRRFARDGLADGWGSEWAAMDFNGQILVFSAGSQFYTPPAEYDYLTSTTLFQCWRGGCSEGDFGKWLEELRALDRGPVAVTMAHEQAEYELNKREDLLKATRKAANDPDLPPATRQKARHAHNNLASMIGKMNVVRQAHGHPIDQKDKETVGYQDAIDALETEKAAELTIPEDLSSREPKQLLDQFAQRMEDLLYSEQNPQPLMEQILEAAEFAGIVDATGAIRTKSAEAFVMDLLTYNLQAMDWVMQAHNLRPLAISDSDDLIEMIVSA